MKQIIFILLLIVSCKATVVETEEPQQILENKKKVEGFKSITSWKWYVEYKDGSRIGGQVSADSTSSKAAMDHAFDISEPHARDTSKVKYYVVKPIYQLVLIKKQEP